MDASATKRFPFDNTYARLPDRFRALHHPTPVAAPRLIKLNVELAKLLQFDPDVLASQEGVEILSGNLIAEGSEPLAIAYAGHQFGNFVPTLGDGRANLLGEVVAQDGRRYDIQLKGSGPTPFSRRGDGRAALGPVLREYIVSEAMFALGIPTTRALAAIESGEKVFRENIEPGGVFTRVAASHLRVGTFQYFAARQDLEGLQTLTDFALARHYPEAARAVKPASALLQAVTAKQAHLIAQWMLLGFIHGVMNTDNSSISGETIDYGPCAFMEAYDPAAVFSSIDRQSRYAYGNQPVIALWNLTRLAEALLPLIEKEEGSEEAATTIARSILSEFQPQYEAALVAGLRRKLGLMTEEEGDYALAQDLLDRMTDNHADFTLTFRRLCESAASLAKDDAVRSLFDQPDQFDAWGIVWRERLARESVTAEERASAMLQTNPAYIPRNHLVEAVIRAAIDRQDFQPFEDLLAAVTDPYVERPGRERFATPARPEERVCATFCGT